MLHIDTISLFPEMFTALTHNGITGRAHGLGLYDHVNWNPRDFTHDPYRRVDDRPYGGGPGMVMSPQPLSEAIVAAGARQALHGLSSPLVYLSPQGRPATHSDILALQAAGGFTLLCGRYEGIDQRLIDTHVDMELCVGDFVVSGGELPAMMLMDAVIRLLPGALNDAASAREDSFYAGGLDYPHYTRPELFNGVAVPPVLLGGNHSEIAVWRAAQAHATTQRVRPDLLK